MSCPIRRTALWAALLALAATGGATSSRAQDPPPPKCCFSNPGYSGTCEVRPAKSETCGKILDYLNNPMAQGKSYCDNTQIRGGWESIACVQKSE